MPVGAGDEPGDAPRRPARRATGRPASAPTARWPCGPRCRVAVGGGPGEVLAPRWPGTGPRSRGRWPSRCFDTPEVTSCRAARSTSGAQPLLELAPAARRAGGGRTRGRSCGRAPSAARTSRCAGREVLDGAGSAAARPAGAEAAGRSRTRPEAKPRSTCHTRWVDWTGGAVVVPPLRPGRAGPRRTPPAPSGSSVPGFRSPPRLGRRAAVDQALAGRRHGGGGRAGPAVARRPGRPRRGRRRRQRPRGAGRRPGARRPVATRSPGPPPRPRRLRSLRPPPYPEGTSPAGVAQLVDAEGLNPSGLARAMRVRSPPPAPRRPLAHPISIANSFARPATEISR